MKSTAQLETQFADVKAILDTAMQHGGGTYTATTYGKAVSYRHRMYAFRKAWREASAPDASVYDLITFRQVPKGETAFRIDVIVAEGSFSPDAGEPVALVPGPTQGRTQGPTEDDWERQARALAERIL